MTTAVQTSYRPQIAYAVEGMIADETSASVGSWQCETTAIPFGRVVSQSTTVDGNCVLGSTSVGILGVSVRDVTLDRMPIDPLSDTEATADTYPAYANVGVLTRGRIWVKTYGSSDVTPASLTTARAVKAGDAVYYDVSDGTFTNSASGRAANGTITFTSQPAAGNTVTFNGDAWTFVASGALGVSSQINIGATLGDTVSNIAKMLNASAGTNAELFQYSAYPPSPGGSGEGSGAYILNIGAEAVGTAGNALSVATNVTGATVSGPTLSGGTLSAVALTGAVYLTSANTGELAQISLSVQK